ncbi:unnamed protein product [Periconia digitata]|uniref:Uncharacterized protein n=1 Tax=Periconia digitata TaxID=1303443 RepID=A0A9W4TZ08_9PLEO|nr:unnamed protein product [Periconia digitata]
MCILTLLLTLLLTISNTLGAPANTLPIRAEPGTYHSASTGLYLHNTGYQGEGLYQAVFDDSGSATIDFTTLDELNITTTPPPAEDDPSMVHKSTSINFNVHCSKDCSFDLESWQEMDDTQRMMADWFGGPVERKATWYWLVRGQHLSYICLYKQGVVSRDLFNFFMNDVRNSCSRYCNGYGRGNWPEAHVWDMSVGNANLGGTICDKHFTPPPSH